MSELIVSMFGEALLWFQDDKSRKRKKRKRSYEKRNNLPKKTLFHPSIKIIFILLILGLISYYVIEKYYLKNLGDKKTKMKIVEIERILTKEKNQFGRYPEKLELIIRNKPLKKNIIYDYWGNEFYYSRLEKEDDYDLFSLGKDGLINTIDDIKRE